MQIVPERFESVSVVTAPTLDPVTLDEALYHLRIDDSDSDTQVSRLISAATAYVEQITGRALVTQTLDVVFRAFAAVLEIPRPALQSITSVKYYDIDGVEQTLDSAYYDSVLTTCPGAVALADGYAWPDTWISRVPAVTVRVVAGYGDPADVPETIRQAILLLVGHWFDNREASVPVIDLTKIPLGVDALLAPYRIRMF